MMTSHSDSDRHKCPRCGKIKRLSDYYGGRTYACKTCVKQAMFRRLGRPDGYIPGFEKCGCGRRIKHVDRDLCVYCAGIERGLSVKESRGLYKMSILDVDM